MKETPARSLFPLALAAALIAAPARAEPVNSVNFGVGGIPRTMPHCAADVYNLEYERAFGDHHTLLFRVATVNYRFDNGHYQESGTIRGLDLGARRYRGGRMEGLFWGGSLGVWPSEWSFVHTGVDQGRATSWSTRLNLELGYRIPLGGSNVSLLPEVSLGKFFGYSSCNYTAPANLVGAPCSQKSEVNAYLFVGLLAGVRF